MTTTLSIACAADSGYVRHCAAMLQSLAVVHADRHVRVHFLHDRELDPQLRDRLGTFATELGLDWQPCLVPDEMRERFPPHPQFGRVAWYRVGLPELLPDVARVLYLDADLIVTDDLGPLWDTDLGDAPVAAVTNPLYPGMTIDSVRAFGVPDRKDYFNSGVLLLDLDRWRRDGIVADIQELVDRGVGLDQWPDQTALNAVLWRRRMALHPRWNAQNTIFDLQPKHLPFSRAEVEAARRAPAIVHFIGPYKPWHHRCKHPLRDRYFEHLDRTPWANRDIEGATLAHRALRLLPASAGYRVEGGVHRALARSRAALRR